MSETRHIALLIETSRAYGRGALRGVKRYMSENGPGSAFIERRGLNSPVPAWLKRWRGDGIITRTESQALVDAIQETGLPGVELRPTASLNNPLPVVRTNDHAAGRLAAEHFLENQFHNFGCCTIETRQQHPQFKDRCEGFVATSRAAGYACSVHRSTSRREEPANWESQQDDLSEWVSALPKPVGVLATTDQMGFWLLDACSRAGVSVPEDVAVVGVEDDQLLCELTTPPLSSVRLNTTRVGYEAASLLDRLMSGAEAPTEPLMIDPLRVVARQSSDVLAVDDKDVAAAVRFIREHACDGITVDDVVAAIHMSRSPLERRMRIIPGGVSDGA